jgi:outer membrane protein assembly factor BamB
MKRQLLATLLIAGTASSLFASDWPRFRGPNGQGLADCEVPLKWDTESGVEWSIDLPGPGSSSPIVIGEKIFVTCFSNEDSPGKRHIVCIDAKSGKQLWTDAIAGPAREDSYRGYLTEHGYASATPVSDGTNVYAFFGKAGVVAWTVDGKKLWEKPVGDMSSNRQWGSAASPVLAGEILVVNASEERRAILGLSTKTGEELWKAEYNALELCYATPVMAKGEADVTEAVISMPGEVWGLNPTNGKLRWYCEIDNGGNVSPGVVVGKEHFFTFGGYPEQQTNAIKRGGREDITKSHRAWKSRNSTYVPTPVLFDDHLYWVTDRAQAMSANAKSGEVVARTRLKGIKSGGRPVYSSPVKAGNKIYVVTRRSGTFVFEAKPEMPELAKNPPLDDTDFNATPAISDGRMYLRSNKALYCIK